MKYRKKPVLVEAFRLTDGPDRPGPEGRPCRGVRLYREHAGGPDEGTSGGLHYPRRKRGVIPL